MSANNSTTSGAQGAGENVGQGVKGLVSASSSPPSMMSPSQANNASVAPRSEATAAPRAQLAEGGGGGYRAEDFAYAGHTQPTPPQHEQRAAGGGSGTSAPATTRLEDEGGGGGHSGSSAGGSETHHEERTSFTTRGKKLGAAVAGVFQGIHGAGEVIRGNINSFLDKAGEGVTGNKVATADKHSTDYEQGGHENVAKKGEEAIKQGLNNVQGSTK